MWMRDATNLIIVNKITKQNFITIKLKIIMERALV